MAAKKKAEGGASGGTEVTLREKTWVVLDEARDDFELLDLLIRYNENVAYGPAVLRRLLGDDQYDAALEEMRDPESGRVTIESGREFINGLFEAFNPN